MKKIYRKIKKAFENICLVDKFLLLFMVILMFYTAKILFTGTVVTQNTNTVDVIVRTSAAAIFGYFVSSNFIKKDAASNTGTAAGQDSDPLPPQTARKIQNTEFAGTGENTSGRVRNKIGFPMSDEEETSLELGTAAQNTPDTSTHVKCSNPQVIIVSILGMVSLILLLISSDFADATPRAASTISQLRDFVSACVGFLVSCGKSH